jgi:hypothetical protein
MSSSLMDCVAWRINGAVSYDLLGTSQDEIERM